MADRAFLERLTRELIEQGKLIEAGFVSYRLTVMSPDAGKLQLEETRMAFFAGAQHLFGSLMSSSLDPGAEPTEGELARMDHIHNELQTFLAEFEKKHGIVPRSH